MKIRSALVAAALVAGSGAASAQDDLHSIVKSLITDTVDDDEILVGGLRSGELGENEVQTFTVKIDPMETYIVYGACDFDCYDLDMAILDEDGDEIDADYEDDDVPMIMILPGDAGDRLRIRVDMSGCEEDVCVWAAAVYQQAD